MGAAVIIILLFKRGDEGGDDCRFKGEIAEDGPRKMEEESGIHIPCINIPIVVVVLG